MDKGQHIRVLGWLWVAFGVLILFGAVMGFLSAVVGGMFSGSFVEAIASSVIGMCVMVFLIVISLPSLLTGQGLLNGKGWARIAAMVLGVLNFFSFPLGTALCVYTFWALWGKDADPYFEGAYPRYHERY